MIQISKTQMDRAWRKHRAVETHLKKPRFSGFLEKPKKSKKLGFRFFRFFDFPVRIFTFSCQTL